MDEKEDAEHLLLLPRRRFRPMILVGILALIALIVGSGVFTFKQLTGVGDVLGPAPAPTVTAGSDHFYFEAMPSWGTISVDGQVLAPIPVPGTRVPPSNSLSAFIMWCGMLTHSPRYIVRFLSRFAIATRIVPAVMISKRFRAPALKV